MTNAAHTPGPWINHDGIIRDNSPEGWLVATCRFNPKDDANARLIAAAPELLAAALKAESLLTQLIERGVYLEPGALRELRDAIAKARGQA